MQPLNTNPFSDKKYSSKNIDPSLVGRAKTDIEKLVGELKDLRLSNEHKVALLAKSLKNNPKAPKIILDSIDNFGFRKQGNKVSVIVKFILLNIDHFNEVDNNDDLIKLGLKINTDDLKEITPQLSKKRIIEIGKLFASSSHMLDWRRFDTQIKKDQRFTSEEKVKYHAELYNLASKAGLTDAGFS